MSEINVVSTTQRIVVDPFSSAVAVISGGPMGPAGPPGQVGPPGPGTPNEYVKADGSVGMSGPLSVPGLFSGSMTLNDDQACYIQFSGPVNCCGLWIVSNIAAGCSGLVTFRAGDASAYAAALNIQGVITTGVGALTTGTTDGTDVNLNVFAQNATAPRLYIKNRTGAVRAFRYMLMSNPAASAPVLL